MSHPIREAGGIFGRLHAALMSVDIDWSGLRPEDHDPELVKLAQRVWADRVRTEFRSVQIMTRFLTEVMGAGDPIDIYAGVVDLISDEIRHVALCVRVCKSLGLDARFPDPIPHRLPSTFIDGPMGERALNTAISMLLVSETFSVGFIADLQTRCEQPVIRAVLDATLEDEGEHESFGRDYIAASLKRFPSSTLSQWRKLAQEVVAGYQSKADAVLSQLGPDQRALDAWPEPELVALGLLSPQRQALVQQRTWRETLAPALLDLGLL